MFKQLCTVKLPEYAICYLVNGDSSGLEDADVTAIDEWYASFDTGHLSFHFLDDEGIDPYFCAFPEFGLACDVVDTEVWATVKD